MSHLSRDERLLALDGGLDERRQAHLATCAACRTDVETLGGVLARVRAVDVPEPSPLFWDHLAARVGDAIAREPAPRPDRGWWSPRLAWAAAAVVAMAAGAGYFARSQPDAPPAMVAGHVAPPSTDAIDDGRSANVVEPAASAADDGWALIAAVAEHSANDEALAPQVGQAELAISALSADERRAVARALAAELAPGRHREG